jgi:hypothetical protein
MFIDNSYFARFEENNRFSFDHLLSSVGFLYEIKTAEREFNITTPFSQSFSDAKQNCFSIKIPVVSFGISSSFSCLGFPFRCFVASSCPV